ncbi:MAG TPA: hypothetical protein PLI47_04075 [Bacteroidia bacterium]|nr:hypothetical protein [Bacteroidia bacterium]
MKFTNKPTRIKVGLLLIFLSTSISVVFGQRNVPLSNPENKAALEVHDSRAQSFVAKNLNRFGLDKLKDYDKTLDSSFSSELKDTLELMEKTYLMNSSSLQTNLQQQKNKIQELTEQKSELSTKKNKLLRTAAFTIGVWLILVIIFIQFKKRKIGRRKCQYWFQKFEMANQIISFLFSHLRLYHWNS